MIPLVPLSSCRLAVFLFKCFIGWIVTVIVRKHLVIQIDRVYGSELTERLLSSNDIEETQSGPHSQSVCQDDAILTAESKAFAGNGCVSAMLLAAPFVSTRSSSL